MLLHVLWSPLFAVFAKNQPSKNRRGENRSGVNLGLRFAPCCFESNRYRSANLLAAKYRLVEGLMLPLELAPRINIPLGWQREPKQILLLTELVYPKIA